MDQDKKNIMRNALTQMTGTLTDNAMSDLIMVYDLPSGLTVKVAQAVIKGAMQGVMQNCYDDVTKRQLSSREVHKHLLVFDIAEKTFMELAISDNVDQIAIVMDDSEMKYAYEVAEHLSLEAIKQSQDKKIEILGRYYGKRFYQGPADWQDMHQIITMTGSLSLRQIVLIRLINERFKDIDQEMYITNPSACVEINRMRDYGLWRIDMAMFENDSSAGIQIKILTPTKYTKTVCDALMLEKLSDDDIKRTIDSLVISKEGEPASGISKEEYESSTQWTEYDEDKATLTINQRRKSINDITTTPEDTAHVHRGKDMINNASDVAHSGKFMQGIDYIMDALVEFKQCKAKVLYQTTVDDALKELNVYFKQCKKEGGLRILEGKRQKYESILADLRSEYLKESLAFLMQSEEKPEGYDKELSVKAIKIDNIFKV